MKYLIISLILSFSGCVTTNPYSNFFQPNGDSLPDDLDTKSISDVIIVNGSYDDIEFEKKASELRKGKIFLGRAYFYAESTTGGDENAKRHAKKIGASHVLIARKFKNTNEGNLQLTTPTQETTFHSGTVGSREFSGNIEGANFSGSIDGFNYSGTSTTYGTKTTNIPYKFDVYEVKAKFFSNASIKVPEVSKSTEEWMKERGYLKK